MYRPTESVDWCQCCQRGVAFLDLEGSSDFFRDNNTPEVIHPTSNSCCFPISFSFSCRERPMCRSCFVLQCGTARRPFPTIILQITLLVSVNDRRLFRKERKTPLRKRQSHKSKKDALCASFLLIIYSAGV